MLGAPFEPIVHHAEVEHVGAQHPEVGHIGSLLAGSLDECGCESWGGNAHVARDADMFGSEVADEAAADEPCHFFVDLAGVKAADVVGLEDLGVDAHLVGSLTRHGR
jgi:hypothetical protein